MLKPREKIVRKSGHEEEKYYLRFSIVKRIEHWVFMASFTTLGLTGLIQKFASSPVSETLIGMLGGIETTRVIHRTAATIMMLVVVYHVGAVGYRLFVQRKRMTMLPTLDDARIAWSSLIYNLGFKKAKPQQGRYTFEEKLEYWAVVWGTVIMALTGFMMWNPISTARFLPGEFIPAAKAAHGGEALLAVLAIIIWHLYAVLIKTFNKSMFNGYVSEEEMLDEHPLELADIKAGIVGREEDPEMIRKRARKFWPTYSVIAVVLTLGIVWFISFEQTAIATIQPAETEVVFVPLTPTPLPTSLPSPTPGPGGALTAWNAGVADLFAQKCGSCHNDSGAPLGGLNLLTYAGAMQGGISGEVILPGDPNASLLIEKQLAGDHPGQLTPDEIQQISDWIADGAPEN